MNETQPGLLEAIPVTKTSLRGAGAHERRRAESLNSCRTLDELTKELKHLGFNLSSRVFPCIMENFHVSCLSFSNPAFGDTLYRDSVTKVF